jgi:hypothetical protein
VIIVSWFQSLLLQMGPTCGRYAPGPRHPRCFKCPTCRVRTPADEINYVSAGASRVRVERWPAPATASTGGGGGDSTANAGAMDAQLGTEDEQLAGEAGLAPVMRIDEENSSLPMWLNSAVT